MRGQFETKLIAGENPKPWFAKQQQPWRNRWPVSSEQQVASFGKIRMDVE